MVQSWLCRQHYSATVAPCGVMIPVGRMLVMIPFGRMMMIPCGLMVMIPGPHLVCLALHYPRPQNMVLLLWLLPPPRTRCFCGRRNQILLTCFDRRLFAAAGIAHDAWRHPSICALSVLHPPPTFVQSTHVKRADQGAMLVSP